MVVTKDFVLVTGGAVATVTENTGPCDTVGYVTGGAIVTGDHVEMSCEWWCNCDTDCPCNRGAIVAVTGDHTEILYGWWGNYDCGCRLSSMEISRDWWRNCDL